jgi:hypothetical protein
MKEYEFYSNECGCPVCGTFLIFPQQQWHDAVKEPPKEDGFYLATSGKSIIMTLFANDGGWTYPQVIDHWMPLPLPPERSGE